MYILINQIFTYGPYLIFKYTQTCRKSSHTTSYHYVDIKNVLPDPDTALIGLSQEYSTGRQALGVFVSGTGPQDTAFY